MNKNKCPCYECLVSVMCPGKEPTQEEWDEISIEVDESDKNDFNSWSYKDIEEPWEELEIPKLEAQEKCPYYKKWQNNLNQLDSWLGKDMGDIKCP